MGARRRCCCGCEIGRDQFNRDDSLTLGPNWPATIEGNTAQTGDWDIHDNTAEMQDASGGIAIFGTKHPIPDESMVAWINCPDMRVGDIYEVIVNWKDMNNYHFGQVEVTIESPQFVMWITARLGVCSGGVRSILTEVEVGRSFRDQVTGLHHIVLNALIGDEGFCLNMLGTGPDVPKIWDEATPIAGGYWAGMGASGTRNDIQIDDFVFWKHFENLRDCPYCTCKCGNTTIPKSLTATLVDCTGRMAEAEGCTVAIEWQQETVAGLPNLPYSGWYGTTNCCASGTIMVNFQCADSDDPTETTCYTLDCNTGGGLLHANEGSTCSPLFLRFGPFYATIGDLICGCGQPFVDPSGEFYIEITETA